MTGSIVGTRSDVGWITSTTLQQVTALAVAGINTANAYKMAKLQADIAQQNQDIANCLNEHMKENYYPCEVKLIQEVCAMEEPDIEYDLQAGRFATTAKLQFAQVRETLDRQFNRFCCGNYTSLLKDIALAEARTTTDAINYGYRVAEARQQALSDLRHSRIFSVLGMGRGIAATALSYSSAAGAAFSSLGTQASTAAGQALNELFYRRTQASDPLQGLQYNARNALNNISLPVGGSTGQVQPQSQQVAQFALPSQNVATSLNGYQDPYYPTALYNQVPNNDSYFQDQYGVGTSGDD